MLRFEPCRENYNTENIITYRDNAQKNELECLKLLHKWFWYCNWNLGAFDLSFSIKVDVMCMSLFIIHILLCDVHHDFRV